MESHNASRMVGVGLVIVFGLLNAFGIEAFGKAEIVHLRHVEHAGDFRYRRAAVAACGAARGLVRQHAEPNDPFAVFSLIGDVHVRRL